MDKLNPGSGVTPPTGLLTMEEAAERMNMSARHVRRLVAERRIAHHRFGRRVRLAPADVDAYIDAGRVEPITEADVWRDIRGVG
jgi:excisionase family DNA binding protein